MNLFFLIIFRKSTDYQIIFGHYPTSTVLSPNPGIKSIIGQNSSTLTYLCGHLHTLNGLAPNMVSKFKQAPQCSESTLNKIENTIKGTFTGLQSMHQIKSCRSHRLGDSMAFILRFQMSCILNP